jgi:predicted site-specific integrase-resolvase
MQQTPHPQHRPRAVYTIKRFADEVGISTRTVWRLVAAGKIKTIKISIGRTGIPASELKRIEAGDLLQVADGAR